MRRAGLVLVLLVGLASAAGAQLAPFPRPLVPYDFEQVTVAGVAIGLTAAKVTPATGRPADYVVITVETADVRCRVDGTAPTATVGDLLPVGSSVALVGWPSINGLSCIRTGATSATLDVSYYRMAL